MFEGTGCFVNDCIKIDCELTAVTTYAIHLQMRHIKYFPILGSMIDFIE